MNFNNFINTYFDKVYLINLDSRPDRLETVHTLLSKYNIKYTRISGVYLKDKYTDSAGYNNTSSLGHLGCILSHLKCLQDSLDNNLNRVLVLEDDITFIEDHINQINFETLYNGIQDINWDLFYLGATFDSKLCNLKKHIDEPTGEVWATQSIAYNKNIIKKIINKIPQDPDFYIKQDKLSRLLPIDVVYHRNFPNKKRIAINPIICVQNDNVSDIVPLELRCDNYEYQLSRWFRNRP